MNLKTRGTDVYMDHAKPLLAQWAVDDGPVELHDFTEHMNTPRSLIDAMMSADRIIAHNAFFEQLVSERLLQLDIHPAHWHCTQAQALAHSLPGGLGALCEVLEVPQDLAKLEDGKRLIRKFCGPKPFDKSGENELDWELFKDYARHDILALREVYKRLPNWNYVGHEKRVWDVDQEINLRGFLVDRQFAQNTVTALLAEKKRLNQQTFELTNEQVAAATQRDKLLLYLCEHQGVILKDLRAPTIEEALEFDNLDQGTKELLKVRLQSAKASPSKYKRLLDCVGAGDRLRGTLQYSGAARTSRWAGRMFQPHNLPRPTMNKADIRAAVELFRSNLPEAIPMLAPLNEASANAARGVIVAPKGHVLQGSDYSSIEGRGNAWIAGEEWKLEAFAAKKDMYCLIYERAFDLAPGTVAEEGDDRRQQGKVMELALGYQGGVGAFVNMAAAYDMDLEDLGRKVKPTLEAQNNYEWALTQGRDYGLPPEVWMACETLKLGYRKGNPKIVELWSALEANARFAIRNPKKKYYCGRLVFESNAQWLRIQLPSGRYLCYALPRIHGDDRISHMSWRNRRWVRTGTYGGKLDENIVQALSRDILAAALVRLHDAGYSLVLHVHDEAVAEVPKGRPLKELVDIMVQGPGWADGFPIAAKGFELERYEKT